MKKYLIASIIVLLTLLTSCSGVVGEDGDVFICYTWVSISQVYTEDPSFGQTIYNEVYETATEGTWAFEYTSLDKYWTGTYTVYRNPGEIGYDGDDIYFMLTLYSIGPSFYDWSYPYYNNRTVDNQERGNEYTETISKSGYTIELHAELVTE